jgi:PKD repeat protein
VTAREFYDLVDDPDQLVNLLGDRTTANDPDVATWAARLGVLRGCDGPTCLVTEGTVNAPPTAVIGAPAVTGLTASVSGTGSYDSDGSITGYQWQFGDGGMATGVTASHTYAAAGTYPVTLTVTDDANETGSATRAVTVGAPPPVGRLTFRGASARSVNALAAPVTVPATAQAGDALLLFVVAGRTDTTITVPPGWTLLRRIADGALQSAVWWRSATATDHGATVAVRSSVTAKTTVQLLAYWGVGSSPVAAFAAVAEPGTTARHRTPTVSVTTAGSWLVSCWADRTGASTGWTSPANVTRRAQSVGSGGGHVTSLSADSGGPAATGTVGGITATSSAPSSAAVMWSIVLAPSR